MPGSWVFCEPNRKMQLQLWLFNLRQNNMNRHAQRPARTCRKSGHKRAIHMQSIQNFPERERERPLRLNGSTVSILQPAGEFVCLSQGKTTGRICLTIKTKQWQWEELGKQFKSVLGPEVPLITQDAVNRKWNEATQVRRHNKSLVCSRIVCVYYSVCVCVGEWTWVCLCLRSALKN